MAGLVVAVPVVSSGADATPMALDSSSSTATGVMAGSPAQAPAEDRRPAPPSAAPGATTGPTPPPAGAAATPDASAVAPGEPLAGPADASPPPPLAAAVPVGGVAPGAEADVLAAVNVARAESGCEPLASDEGLASVARAHSADMRDRSFFDHVNPTGLDPFDRAEAAGQTNARAENIAMGQPTPATVMAHWSDSPEHRANMLDCSLRTLGVGVAEGTAGHWWTQLFGD